MSDAVAATLISGVVATISLLIKTLFDLQVMKNANKQQSVKLTKVAADVDTVRHATNSLKDELVAEVRSASYAAGRKDQRALAEEPAIIVANTDSTVANWSATAASLFGWTEQEAVGKKLEDLIIPEDYQGIHHDAMKACVDENRAPRSMPVIFKARDKYRRVFLVEVWLSEIKRSGQRFFQAAIRKRAEKVSPAPEPSETLVPNDRHPGGPTIPPPTPTPRRETP